MPLTIRPKPFILIAEDDTEDQYLLKTAFKENGYTEKLEFVENGVDLLEFLEKIKSNELNEASYPNFILLDLNMPKKDGREALKEIKQHSVFKKIPVIIFSTTKNETEIKRCYELGANTYIIKPVSFDRLLKVIEEVKNYWFTTASIPN